MCQTCFSLMANQRQFSPQHLNRPLQEVLLAVARNQCLSCMLQRQTPLHLLQHPLRVQPQQNSGLFRWQASFPESFQQSKVFCSSHSFQMRQCSNPCLICSSQKGVFSHIFFPHFCQL